MRPPRRKTPQMPTPTYQLPAFLFVPGDDDRKLAKSLQGQADTLIFDLEDAVAARDKPAARTRVATALDCDSDKKRFVRVNGLTTGWTEADLAAIVPAAPDGYVLPKCEGPEDIDRLAGAIARLGGATEGRVLAIATETARAVRNLVRADWSHDALFGLTWGGEDLSADLGCTQNRQPSGRYHSVFTQARDHTLLAAREAGVFAIDAVFPSFRDTTGLQEEASEACVLGFDGKMAIHPAQIAPIQAAFRPSADQVAWARRVVERLDASASGVAEIDGHMLDRPHLLAAQRLLSRL